MTTFCISFCLFYSCFLVFQNTDMDFGINSYHTALKLRKLKIVCLRARFLSVRKPRRVKAKDSILHFQSRLPGLDRLLSVFLCSNELSLNLTHINAPARATPRRKCFFILRSTEVLHVYEYQESSKRCRIAPVTLFDYKNNRYIRISTNMGTPFRAQNSLGEYSPQLAH